MILTLTSESVRNTVFTDENGLPVFKTDTPFSLGVRTTTIHRRTPDTSEIDDSAQVVGSIVWHILGSSIFTIGGTELKSDEFLPKVGFFGRKRTFTGPDGRRYRWDINLWDVVLSLDDESNTEIARYHKASLGIIGKRQSATLEIAAQAEDMLELVLLTFIYVEKLRRDAEKRRRHAGGAGGT